MTITADNASNNATMTRALARKLESTGIITDIDPEKATIRCLAHVIHLAVMAMLVELGAISKDDADSVALDTNELAEDQLEIDGRDLDEADMSDEQLEWEIDPSVDLSSIISKVSVV